MATEETAEELTYEERRKIKDLAKLKKYVDLQAYQPVKPPRASDYTESLAQPKPRTIVDNSKQFAEFMEPDERGERLKRLAAKFQTITTEYALTI